MDANVHVAINKSSASYAYSNARKKTRNVDSCRGRVQLQNMQSAFEASFCPERTVSPGLFVVLSEGCVCTMETCKASKHALCSGFCSGDASQNVSRPSGLGAFAIPQSSLRDFRLRVSINHRRRASSCTVPAIKTVPNMLVHGRDRDFVVSAGSAVSLSAVPPLPGTPFLRPFAKAADVSLRSPAVAAARGAFLRLRLEFEAHAETSRVWLKSCTHYIMTAFA